MIKRGALEKKVIKVIVVRTGQGKKQLIRRRGQPKKSDVTGGARGKGQKYLNKTVVWIV